jgi:hypothetical protein
MKYYFTDYQKALYYVDPLYTIYMELKDRGESKELMDLCDFRDFYEFIESWIKDEIPINVIEYKDYSPHQFKKR